MGFAGDIYKKLLHNKYGESTVDPPLTQGETQGPPAPDGGMGDVLASRAKAPGGLSLGTHIAAAGSGMGQALMGGKFGKAFNAGAGGYADLYRAMAYPKALGQEQNKGFVNKLKNKSGQILNQPDLELLERGMAPNRGGY